MSSVHRRLILVATATIVIDLAVKAAATDCHDTDVGHVLARSHQPG